jgi:large subunit ribosomal protein L6
MSRVGKAPIAVPAKVTVTVEKGNLVTVSGPKGALDKQQFDPDMQIEVENGQVR